MNTYKRNKARAVFVNTEPTMTDQSQANDTDINVIVKRYAATGTAPGATRVGVYEDMTQVPNNLRDMIEQTRGVAKLRRNLPPEIREMPLEQILALTEEDLKRIFPKPDKPSDEPKGATT